MSNNKQSSIEWLTQEALEWNIDKRDGSHYIKFPKEAFKKAAAMHKVEIVNAVDGFPIHTRNMGGEEYYNEIFGE